MVWLFSKNKIYGLYSGLTIVIVLLILRIPSAFYFPHSANKIISVKFEPAHNAPDGADWFWAAISAYGISFTYVSCYFCGVTLAFLMMIIDEKVKHFALKKWQYLTMMILSGYLLLCLVLWPFADMKDAPESRWGMASNAWYNAFGKTAWVKSPCSLSSCFQ